MRTGSFGIAVALSLVLISGCSSKLEIDGEAFVESDAGAKKLPLVRVQVVPEAQFAAKIKEVIPKAEAEAKKLQAEIDEFEKRDAEASALRSQGDLLRAQAAAMGIAGVVSAQNAIAAQRNADQMNSGRVEAQRKAREVAALSSGASALFFRQKFDGAIQTVESNADGKFKLTLDAGQRVVLVAEKDNLAWALWLTPDESKRSITLSNRNLSGSGCDGCVFGGSVTPKSMSGI